jgi:sec-independent protein translocase protein TatB
MFDIAWVEMMVVAIVMVVVIGPKELPVVLRSIGQWIAQARAMARNFQDSIEELAEETGLDQVRDEVQAIRDFRLEDEIEKTIDPEGELRDGIESDIGKKKSDDFDEADDTPESPEITEAEMVPEDAADGMADKKTKAESAASGGEDKA